MFLIDLKDATTHFEIVLNANRWKFKFYAQSILHRFLAKEISTQKRFKIWSPNFNLEAFGMILLFFNLVVNLVGIVK
jgi:hypothetical protein